MKTGPTHESSKSKAKSGPGACPASGVLRRGMRICLGAADVGQIPASSMFEEAPRSPSQDARTSANQPHEHAAASERASPGPATPRSHPAVNFFDIRLVRKGTARAHPPRIVFVDLPGYGAMRRSPRPSTRAGRTSSRLFRGQ